MRKLPYLYECIGDAALSECVGLLKLAMRMSILSRSQQRSEFHKRWNLLPGGTFGWQNDSMQNLTRLFLALVVFTSSAAVWSRAQSTTAPDYESLRADWVQRLESRDLAGSLALYAGDATFTNPDGTHVSGASLRALYKDVFESFTAKIVMSPRAHAFSGSLGYESGSYAEDLTQIANGERRHVTGDYLTVYRQTDSSGWLIVEQVWTQAAIASTAVRPVLEKQQKQPQ